MKQLLLLFCFLVSFAAAADGPRARRWDAAPEHATPAIDSVQLRAAHYTQYLTDALRLSSRQTLAMRRCALLPAAAPAAPARQEFDHALLRILTPGQYCAFSRLADTMLP